MQAAFLRIFLQELDGWNAGRRAAAARYAELGLGELVEIPQDEPGHVYHLFVCRSPERDRIRAALTEAGIASATYYTTPLHLQPSLRYLGYEPGSLPATEHAGAENFSLPLWPGMPAEAQERVVETVRAAVGVAGAGLVDAPVLSWHRLLQFLGDVVIVAAAWWLAFELRFDHGLNLPYTHAVLADAPDRHRIELLVFVGFGFYNRWWRYVSIRDMWPIVRGVVVASLLADLTVYLVNPGATAPVRLPRGVAAMDLLLTLAFVAGTRLLARTLIERPTGGVVARGKEVIVVGAGDAGPPHRPGDAALAAAQLHADRLRRRRPAQVALADHGSARSRHARRSRARAG